jgi:hypothetical protein
MYDILWILENEKSLKLGIKICFLNTGSRRCGSGSWIWTDFLVSWIRVQIQVGFSCSLDLLHYGLGINIQYCYF